MDKSIAAYLFIVATVSLGNGQNPFQLFEAKKYNESLQVFLQLENQGAAGKDLYLNIAKVYASLNQYAHAILYTERALLWDPNCNICKDMLGQYNRAAGIDPFTPPTFFLLAWYQFAAGWLSPLYWFCLSMLALSAALFLWKVHSAFTYRLLIVRLLLLIFAVCLTVSYIEDHRRTHASRAVLIEATALHLSPDPMSQKKEELIPGEVFVVTDTIGEWSKVRSRGLDVGWIESKKLHYIAM